MKTVGLSDRKTLPNERNLTIKTFCAFVIIFWRSINLKCLFLKKASQKLPRQVYSGIFASSVDNQIIPIL